MLKGITKLPVGVTQEQAMNIYKTLARVNKTIGRLDMFYNKSIVDESILNLFRFNESVQSTRIEGTQVTFHEIMETKENSKLSWQQQEVINYKNAIDYGVQQLRNNMPISTRLIKQLHEILMTNARGTTSSGGEYRKVQNFIGPDNKIENATYIPIPAHEIDEYMANLEHFINGQNHSSFDKDKEPNLEYFDYECDSLIKIAIAHAQFESIHPFLDGNGRLGRILIALLAVSEGLVTAPLFFVSEELEKERIRYYNALNATRGQQPDWYNWIQFFMNASGRMATKMIGQLERAETLAKKGISLCKIESHKKVWLATFSQPITTSARIAESTGLHNTTTKKALDYLVEKGLLEKEMHVKRNIKYYNYDLLRVISD